MQGAAPGCGETPFGGFAQDRRTERIRLDEAAFSGDEFEWEAFGYCEIKTIAPLEIVRPFAVGTEISYRRFYFDDDERAIMAQRQQVGASSIGKRNLGERPKATLRQAAGNAAGECFGDFAGVRH